MVILRGNLSIGLFYRPFESNSLLDVISDRVDVRIT